MKRILAVLLFAALLFAWSLSANAYNGDVTVYITNSGECYHRQNCSYLSSSKEITLEDAVQKGYRPCSRCKPPKLGEESDTDDAAYKAPAKSSSGSSKSSPSQTQALPKETPDPQQIIIQAETESKASRSSTVPIIIGLAGVGVGAAAAAVRKRKR